MLKKLEDDLLSRLSSAGGMYHIRKKIVLGFFFIIIENCYQQPIMRKLILLTI